MAAGTTGHLVEKFDTFARAGEEFPVTVTPKWDPDVKMRALQWQGKRKVEVHSVSKPLITDPADIVLKVTSTAICGSDLHLYVNGVAGMKPGDILGHEFMGVIEDVGPKVKNRKKGDRVVTCFDISCGYCYWCKQQNYSCCGNTNPSKAIELMWGQGTGGFFGYSHLTGGYPGGQAQYVRVPFGKTVNLLSTNCQPAVN
eukprot:jgi/Chrzof1/7769/Cz02g36030.t1